MQLIRKASENKIEVVCSGCENAPWELGFHIENSDSINALSTLQERTNNVVNKDELRTQGRLEPASTLVQCSK
jgi:hypothetical protein